MRYYFSNLNSSHDTLQAASSICPAVPFRGAATDYRRLSPQPSIIWPKVGLLRIRLLIEPDFDFKSALLDCRPTSFHNQIPLDEVIQPCSDASCVIFVS